MWDEHMTIPRHSMEVHFTYPRTLMESSMRYRYEYGAVLRPAPPLLSTAGMTVFLLSILSSHNSRRHACLRQTSNFTTKSCFENLIWQSFTKLNPQDCCFKNNTMSNQFKCKYRYFCS